MGESLNLSSVWGILLFSNNRSIAYFGRRWGCERVKKLVIFMDVINDDPFDTNTP